MEKKPLPESRPVISLLGHCTECKSKCCRENRIIITAEEHEKIVDSGAPDYFYRITIPQGDYYFLNYTESNCFYLQENGQCGIEQVKPDICKSFPVRPTSFGDHDIADWCPAKAALTKKFVEEAKRIVQSRIEKIDLRIYNEVRDAYCARGLPRRLEAMNATVTEPPALRLEV